RLGRSPSCARPRGREGGAVKTRAARPEGCVSDFTLDRRLARELDDAEREVIEAHVTTCERCLARAGELHQDRERFAREAPAVGDSRAAAPLALDDDARAKRRWMGQVGAALALAAAIVLVAAFRRGDVRDGTRTKGGKPVLGFYVNHQGNVRLGGADEGVVP